ncbi:aspartate/glutamate racemase family protein [Prosthecomicrobium hirschii]|uniref:aspartate/glutamate racemase family protein n=1 Tax=Prosthecodimorpha hirschii TaxID=665126 RepID=UPI00221F14BF|nr:aspartate/glutamate racemase family protein [Prosthecomicrobium hirschii]
MSRIIGLIGGMSWESTATYYREINELVRARRGGLASADLLLRSVDFEAIVALQKAGRWDLAEAALAGAAEGLVRAGAGCILICTNTMHLVADGVARAASVPLIHIVDVVGQELVAAGKKRPLLLATRYTMEQAFYRDRLRARFGLEAIVPEAQDRGAVHDIIFDELCCGVVRSESRQRYVDVIEAAAAEGADSVILGCTEIGLLIHQTDSNLPVFDSTKLHARAAVDFSDGSLQVDAVAA